MIANGVLVVNKLRYSEEDNPTNPGTTNNAASQVDVRLIKIALVTSSDVLVEKNVI